MPFTIGLLADRPDLIDALAEAYRLQWPSWYGPGGRGDAVADLTARAQRGRIPLGLVAIEDGAAIGTCALTEESMSRSGDFGAWLVGLWVAPERRRQGLGLELIRAAVMQLSLIHISEPTRPY